MKEIPETQPNEQSPAENIPSEQPQEVPSQPQEIPVTPNEVPPIDRS